MYLLLSHLTLLALSVKKYLIIRKGGLYIEPDWINLEQVTALRRDISFLRTSPRSEVIGRGFRRSGLSFGNRNKFGASDRLTCTISPILGGDRELRASIDEKLECLKTELEDALGVEGGLLLAEQYYSVSPTGAFLPRHMDERHEETKGEKAWRAGTRRSISWLLFLNESGWDDGNGAGGGLRAYCRLCDDARCGEHEGNVQVGWIPTDSNDTDGAGGEADRFEPIFLDCWVKTRADEGGDDEVFDDGTSVRQLWHPLYAMYRLRKRTPHEIEGRPEKREYLTDVFGPDSPTWPSGENLDPDGFSAALASQLPTHLGKKFVSTEAVHESPVDVVPLGGTLVLFDSVAIPHEVLMTTEGERLAMAGWFHEKQQDFPEWYGS